MKFLKNFSIYLIAPILSLALFAIIFQLWKVDLSMPIFDYSGDSFVSGFVAKIVTESGWFFSSDQIGWPHLTEKFYLHDFPLNADSFNFALFKLLSYFSQESFAVVNYFYLLTIALVSFTSFVVLRSFKISVFVSIIISVLYSLFPYHFYRATPHLFLSNYTIIPLSVMVALWISSNKIQLVSFTKKQFSLAPNRYFLIALFVSLFAAANGIYYAYYSCVIFIFAWFLLGLKNGKFLNRDFLPVFLLCFAAIATLFCLYIPCFIYWINHAPNSAYAIRQVYQSEFFALKIVNLLLPVENHYLDYFSTVRKIFNEAVLQNESAYGSLGFIGSIGFLFLLLWLLAKTQDSENSFFQKTLRRFSLSKNDESLISDLAGLNLLAILFSTVSGLVMLIAISFPMIRAHARFSIFIGFFALFLMAIIFDKIAQKNKNSAYIFLSVIFILGIFDQVGKVSAQTIQPEAMRIKFISDRDFIQKIEKTVKPQTMIFQMPIMNFPEGGNYGLMIGYLYSKNLRWSYPAINGREALLWQKNVIKFDFVQFISELRKAGFSGIYIDRMMMSGNEKNGWQNLRKLESQIKKISKKPAIVSQNLQLIFFEI